RWLNWFIDVAQRPDVGRGDSLERELREFVLWLSPYMEVDWDAEVGVAPPEAKIPLDRKRRKTRRPRKNKSIHCGRPVAWRNDRGQGYCRLRESAARQDQIEDEESTAVMRNLRRLPRVPQLDSDDIANGQRSPTDATALFREILEGLNSFLNNGEWTIAQLSLAPRITWGSEQKVPERTMMGGVRDVALVGI